MRALGLTLQRIGLALAAAGGGLLALIAQNVENADATFYAVYRHYDGDITVGAVNRSLDSFDLVITGAKVNF